MILETKRLILRHWQESDVDILFEYASDPDVGPIAGWPVHESREYSLDVIRNVFNGPECYAVCLKDSGLVVGAIELLLNGRTDMTDRDDECELGYWIGKPHWGNEYAPEAAGRLIEHGFLDLGMRTIWCGYYDGNSKSRIVQEKLGFVFHHTCDEVDVPLLNEVRIGHTNILTRKHWLSGKMKNALYDQLARDYCCDAADFTGMNGCYLYQGRDVKPSKKNDLKDQMLVLAPHEGIVPSDIWLTCRKKLMNNMKIQSARKATHTWLAGKIKCGNCGYALMSINNPVGKQYLRCTKRLDNKSCAGCGKIITSELEAVVYQQMVKKLASYKTLTGRKKAAKANPKIAALQVELAHVDSEIEKLVDSLTGANNVLLSYVNVKIAELDGRKQELLARIAELTVEAISPEQVSQISGYLDTWENVSFDDKRRVVDLMITTIAATSDSLNITWKI